MRQIEAAWHDVAYPGDDHIFTPDSCDDEEPLDEPTNFCRPIAHQEGGGTRLRLAKSFERGTLGSARGLMEFNSSGNVPARRVEVRPVPPHPALSPRRGSHVARAGLD